MSHNVVILQTSDLHYHAPNRDDWKPRVDDHTGSLGAGTLKHASIDPSRKARLDLGRAIRDHRPDLVLFHGDLGYQGHEDLMDQALEYLQGTISNGGMDFAAVRGLVGNHDVCWKRGDSGKYSKVLESWASAGASEPCLGVTWEEVKTDDSSMLLVSANSCQDSGVLVDTLPPKVRTKVNAILDESRKDLATPIEDDLYDFVDLASIDVAQIDDLVARVRDTLPGSLVLFQAHHGLLPQTTPRLGLCPELIQAGYLRNSLLLMERPVIMLHGHVHKPSVFCLSDPSFAAGLIVSVACPEFPLGFNLLHVTFDGSTPLRLRVETYVQKPDYSVFQVLGDVSVPLLSGAARAARLTELSRNVLATMLRVVTARPHEVLEAMQLAEDQLVAVNGALQSLVDLCYLIVMNPSDVPDERIYRWQAA